MEHKPHGSDSKASIFDHYILHCEYQCYETCVKLRVSEDICGMQYSWKVFTITVI